MAKCHSKKTRERAKASEALPASSPPASAAGPQPSLADVPRWAELIASGEIPFPSGLSPEVESRLFAEVNERRRTRLVQFFARMIAQDIARASTERPKEGANHD